MVEGGGAAAAAAPGVPSVMPRVPMGVDAFAGDAVDEVKSRAEVKVWAMSVSEALEFTVGGCGCTTDRSFFLRGGLCLEVSVFLRKSMRSWSFADVSVSILSYMSLSSPLLSGDVGGADCPTVLLQLW